MSTACSTASNVLSGRGHASLGTGELSDDDTARNAPKDVSVHREEIYQRIHRGDESPQGGGGTEPEA